MIKLYYSPCNDTPSGRHSAAWELLYRIINKDFNITARPVHRLEENGKPYFPELPEIRFNLSHTTGYAAAAVSDEGDVGIDIERVRPVSDRVQKRYMGGIFGSVESIRRWCRYEACSKFTGEGVTLPENDRISADIPEGCRLHEYALFADGGLIELLPDTVTDGEDIPEYIITLCCKEDAEPDVAEADVSVKTEETERE